MQEILQIEIKRIEFFFNLIKLKISANKYNLD